MKIRLEETVTVDRPREEVFDYTADFANLADWDPGVESSRRSDDEVEPGTSFDVLARFGSSSIPMTYVITSYERPEQVVLVGQGSRLVATDTIEFTSVPGGTRIDYRADLEFKGWLKWVAPLLRGRLDEVGRRAVVGLANALEREPA